MTWVLVLMAHLAAYNDPTSITAIPGYADNKSCDEAGKAWDDTPGKRAHLCIPGPNIPGPKR